MGRGNEVELSSNLGQKMALEIAWFPWSNFLVHFLLGMKAKEFLFLVSHPNSLPKNTAAAKLYALHRPVRVHDNSSDWGFSDDLGAGRLCGTRY